MKFLNTTLSRIIVGCFILASLPSLGQTGGLSPYSRFGIGILEVPGGVTHAGMGRMTTPVWDAYSINFSNPATYSSLFRTTFQVGGQGTLLNASDSSNSQSLNGSRISEFGFVFKKQGSRWAFALGLVPYSSVNYAISQSSSMDSIGDILYTYDGDGGLNKAIAGVSRAFRLSKPDKGSKAHRLSVGANLSYYFGALHQTRKVIFSDVNYYNTRINTFTNIYDLNADLGLHYLLPLSEEKAEDKLLRSNNLIAALTYSLGNNLNARYTELTESFYYFSQVEVLLDTASYIEEVNGSMRLPERTAFGLAYLHTNKEQGYTLIGIDYKSQDWSKYSVNFGDTQVNDNLQKSSTLSVGFEMIPRTVENSKNFFQRNTYRLGFRNTQTYLLLKNQQISEQAFSAGFSIPLIASRSTSKMNFAIEYGSGGTTENNLIKEQFVNIWLGFSFSPHSLNPWFIHRRYE